jgi:hypothetical protein
VVGRLLPSIGQQDQPDKRSNVWVWGKAMTVWLSAVPRGRVLLATRAQSPGDSSAAHLDRGKTE